MFANTSPHTRAVLQALFVTFLWSTSWVLIKFGLQDIPALTFAGLRFSLAFLCLLPFARRSLPALRSLSIRRWTALILLGLLSFTVTQGSQFLSLFYLPAITTNLLLSFSAVLVALLGIVLLREHPTTGQWGGVLFYLCGVALYFYPLSLPVDQRLGIAIALGGVLANSLSALLGRSLNRTGDLAPLAVTVITMGIGSIFLLAAGISIQGLPSLSLANWAVVLWLAVVNSAFAYTLWNHTLRTLSAMESSIINSTMMIQIPILAWLFLGERIEGREFLGLVVAGAGILIVQLRRLPALQAVRRGKVSKTER